MTDHVQDINAVELAAELTIAWLSNPSTRASTEDVVSFIGAMHSGVSGLAQSTASAAEPAAPAEVVYEAATTARKSLVSKDFIISMIDGKQYKTLRRHLSTNGLTPAEYRERYGLRPDYPMVAPAYSEVRSAMAKKIGLGRKPAEGSTAAPDAKPARSGRTK